MTFTIQGKLPTLNEYIKAERGNKFAAASMKKKATEKVMLSIKDRTKLQHIIIDIWYYCKDKRTDKDNIAFAKKFIFDGLQKAGVIENDGWDNIIYWREYFLLDKTNPRIVVEIKEEK